MRYAVELMTTLNRSARDAMVKYRVHACTDVTGFGLLGHSCEMAEGSGVAIEYEVARFRFIDEAVQLAKEGLLPEGMYATAPSPSAASTPAMPSSGSRTCSMTRRPPAACSWPSTQPTPTRSWQSSRTASPRLSGWAARSSTTAAR